MCEYAAIAGVQPETYTIRELYWMAKAADVASWNRTWAVIAQLFNVNRDSKKSKAVELDAFFPWRQKTSGVAEITESDKQGLRTLFPKKDKK